MKISKIANKHLGDLQVYVPGKPTSELARELGLDPKKIIKLASNENPNGASPLAIKAISRTLTEQNLYPDGSAFYLKNALVNHFNQNPQTTHKKLTPENFTIGTGSNEIIELIMHAFLTPDTEMLCSRHAFAIYRITAQMLGLPFNEAEEKNYHHDLQAIANLITPKTKVIFIANPNNPTGTYLSQAEIDNFMAQIPKEILVVFDEAYHEYISQPVDCMKYIYGVRNVIILRTFSKIYGLAGLRVGYSIAPIEIASAIAKVRQPFNVTAPALSAAISALSDQNHVLKSKQQNDAVMQLTEENLQKLGLEFIKSYGNFVMVDMANFGGGGGAFQKLLQQGIITRPMGGHYLPDWLRISIGTESQMIKLFSVLEKIVKYPSRH